MSSTDAGDFYVTLPSTAGGQEFADNKANHFKVRLPHYLRCPGRGWTVGLSSISLPDARVNLYDLVPQNEYLLQTTWLVKRKNNLLVRFQSAVKMDDIDHLDSVVDGETLVRACIDTVEADRIRRSHNTEQWSLDWKEHPHLKFVWVPHGKNMELLIDNTSLYRNGDDFTAQFFINRKLALRMGWLTEKNELGPNLRQEFIGGYVPDLQKTPAMRDVFDKSRRFRYWDVFGTVFQLSMACNWRFIHLNHAFGAVVGSPNRTLHVYSDAGKSGIVGGQVTDLLREIQYIRRGRGTTYFEPLHVQYLPIRNEVFDVLETQISETDGQLVRFGQGQTIVTLHFKRQV